CEPTGDHITYRVHLAWRTTGDQHVVDERRVVRFAAWEEANVVDVSATYIASYGDVFFGQTKEGGLGMRVHPMLEAEMGGRVIASTGVEGAENIFDTYADWIAVCGNVGPNEVGIMMMPHPSMERIPWFTRGYGLHMYGPFRHRAARLEAGDT